jgi:hypothetical protein
MSARSFVKIVVLAIVSIGICADCAHADKQQLQEKLSKEGSIKLSDVTIIEALDKIGQKAGVKIVLSDEAIWKLPQGEGTRLSVALSGPLSDSMTEMLNAFFMRYAVGDEEITIYPRPELEHVLGRPTTKQLELLEVIYTGTIKVYYLEEVQKTINEALGEKVLISPIEVQAQLNSFVLKLVGKEKEYERVVLPGGATTVRRKLEPNEPKEYYLPTPVTLVQLLSQVVIQGFRDSTYTRWYISGMDFPDQVPEIKVISAKDFQQARLDQVIDVSFKQERADVIIQRLANWTRMELFVDKGDPSWLSEKISVDMQNVKLGQALRNVVSTVDGVVNSSVESNKISVQGPMHEKVPPPPKAAGSGEYVGKISIPMDGGMYYIEFMLRESDLTDQLKKLRAEKMREVLGESAKPAEEPKNK